MVDFSRRNDLTELMDSADTDFETFRACLVDLAKVNILTFGYRPTLAFLDRLLASGRVPHGRPLVIVDVGSGYGDMLRAIGRWAKRHGIAVKLIGVDLNPWSARAAAEATPRECPVEWVSADIFDYVPQQPVDVIISALFTHHLDDLALVRFVAWMEENAGIGWFVNDLHRHPLPYHVFGWSAWALRFHHFVWHDGPISFARAFSAADWRRVLAAAGVPPQAVTVAWRFAFKLCVTRIM